MSTKASVLHRGRLRYKEILLFGLVCCLVITFLWRTSQLDCYAISKQIHQESSTANQPLMPEHLSCTLDESIFEDTRIYQHQNGLEDKGKDSKSFCQDTNYLIVQPPSRGFGAALLSLVNLISLNWDKTIIVEWRWDTGFMSGVKNASQCPNQNALNAWECYFKPVSNCNLDDALQVAGVKEVADIPFWHDAPKDARVVKVERYHGNYEENAIPKDITANFKPHLPPNTMRLLDFSDPWKSQVTRYFLRFNPETRALLEPHVYAARASLKDVDSHRSIALLIRGSDKCNEDVSGRKEPHESDCLPLRLYMDAILDVWKWDQRIMDVIVTSEDSRYIQAVKKFADGPPPPGFESATGGHKFTFHFNEQDIQQGSSLIRNAIMGGTVSSHFDVVMSMWTTIEMAIQARYMILNCGSLFHGLVVNYRQSACHGNGQSPPVIFCLDHKPQQNVAGFDPDTIRKGGSYDLRWEYQ